MPSLPVSDLLSDLAHRLNTCSLLNRLDECVCSRFEQTGNRQYLDWSIALRRLQLDFYPPSFPYQWHLLEGLAWSRFSRYDRLGCKADLDRAIVLWRNAIDFCPRDHKRYPVLLDILAKSHWTRFTFQGRLEDLDEDIQLRRAALSLLSEGHPDHPALVGNLASTLVTRYQQTGNADDLDESITLFRAALPFCPAGHSDRGSMLNNFANALLARFKRYGNENDLNDAIEMHRDILALRRSGHSDRPISLINLGQALLARFKRFGKVDDLNESIILLRAAPALLPDGHPNRPLSLDKLAGSLLERFRQSRNVDDLSEAVQLYRAALALHPEGHPGRPSSLDSLASSLQTRYKQNGSVNDLDEAVRLHRDALSLRPEGHPDRFSSLSNLAITLRTKFEQSGSMDDLDEAVQLHRDALTLCPEGHPDRSSSLDNLAISLNTRFRGSGSAVELDEAVQLHRAALALRPEGHPDRPSSLNNLATSLDSRFRRSGSMNDLNEAVRLYRDTLSLCPEGHADSSSSLSNLATCLSAQFERSGNEEDLNEAIRLYRAALSLRPTGDPDRSGMMLNTATALHTRFERLNDAKDLEGCIQLLAEAATHTFSPILDRLRAARRWGRYARDCDHRTTLDAYRTALSLLQRVLMIRPSISGRHELLTGNDDYQALGTDAASFAIEKGDLAMAIELLEQGRALLWSQIRGLRTPLDRLKQVNKPLAEKFRDVSSRLETLITSSKEGSKGSSVEGAPMHGGYLDRRSDDATMERVRRLSEEQEELIKNIRETPGFEEFLRVLSFKKLQKAASEGPVVVVNHSRFRCDALVVLSSRRVPCICVPLDKDWFLDAVHLSGELLTARYERGIHTMAYDEVLQRVMKALWVRVVSKVVERLRELGTPNGSRIWWCPTSVLTPFPFHAAGPYQSFDGGMRYLLDDYVSSYTPTLTSLITARSGKRTASGAEKFLFVGDTRLKATKKELNNIRKRRRVGRCLLDEEATPDSVIKAFRKVGWVHLACHGSLDFKKPFESSFALPGGRLTLLDIARTKLPNAEFAFLSACHTAEQVRPFVMDESIHLAAAIQFCGFRSVVGTMWKLLDSDGPILADVVYMHLMDDLEEGEVRFKRAAEAVREAALHLRSQKDWSDKGTEVDIMTERWVNLVHFGA